MLRKNAFLFIVLLLFAGCSNKKVCPLCLGKGEVMVEGSMWQCIVCYGDKKVDKETYENFYREMNQLQNSNRIPSGCVEASQDMVDCPMCSGSGIFSFYGESHPCSECNQTGKVTSQRAAQLWQSLQQIDELTGGGGYGSTSIQYNNSSGSGNSSTRNSNSNSENVLGDECRVCKGTGDCTYCHGAKVVECKGHYGEPDDFMKCPVCKGSGDCGVCYGRGKIR